MRPYVNLSFRNDNHIVANPSLSNFKCSIQGLSKVMLGQVPTPPPPPPPDCTENMGPGYQFIFFFFDNWTRRTSYLKVFHFLTYRALCSIEYILLGKIIEGDTCPSPPVPTPIHYADIDFSIKSFDSVFLKGSYFL